MENYDLIENKAEEDYSNEFDKYVTYLEKKRNEIWNIIDK